MRLVQVTIPTGKRDAVLDTLEDAGVDYVLTDEVSGREYTAVVSFPLPVNAVEPILEDLRTAGLERDAYTVVLAAETVVSAKYDALLEEYAAEEDQGRIAREELRARAMELAPAIRPYAILTVVSVVIATAGLLLGSPSVVVGSMVIAPLIGPAMATTVGSVLNERELVASGIRLQVIGLGLAIASATGFALLVKTLHLVPPGLEVLSIGEIAERATPGFLTLPIALGAGVAGAMSLRSGVSASLVGVMIAVALVPPTAAIGIGLAWGIPTLVAGASVLVLVNVLSINLAALGTFWYAGYRPSRLFRLDQARSETLERVGALVVALLVLSVVLGGTTYASYATATTEQKVRTTVEDELETMDVALLDVAVIQSEPLLLRPFDSDPERVVVTVGLDPGQQAPDVAERLRERLRHRESLTVQVRFVSIQTADRLATPSAPDTRALPSPSSTAGASHARTAHRAAQAF